MPLGADAAVDYRSRLRRLEQVLGTPLENAPAMLLRTLASTLKNDPRVVGITSTKFIGDVGVALRAYAGFLDDWDGEGAQRFLPTSALVRELSALGFSHDDDHSTTFVRMRRQTIILYVGNGSIVVHPDFEACYDTLADGRAPMRFCEHADLLEYPRQDNGDRPVHYGIRFSFAAFDSLRRFTEKLQDASTRASRTDPDGAPGDNLSNTETSVMAKARIGQGRFRTDLLHYWQGRCAITGIDNPALLRASHIKPWSDSTDAERLDPFNGLLLAVHLDALFDRAFITFQDGGEMHVSGRLSQRERSVFGLAEQPGRLLLAVPHLEYMRHHRSRFDADGIGC
jgi:hypothetical protein